MKSQIIYSYQSCIIEMGRCLAPNNEKFLITESYYDCLKHEHH